jgi:hypothetical protein
MGTKTFTTMRDSFQGKVQNESLSQNCVHNKDMSRYKFLERIQGNGDQFCEYAMKGREAQKVEHYVEALTYYRMALSSKKISVEFETNAVQIEYANILFDMGVIFMNHVRSYEFSAEALEQCRELRILCLGSNHTDVAATMHCLAHVHMMIGEDYVYALSLLNESLSLLLVNCPNATDRIVTVWHDLARAQYAVGDIEDAESSLVEIRKMKVPLSRFP